MTLRPVAARPNASALPTLDSADANLSRATSAAWAAVQRWNAPPRLFRYAGLPVRVEDTEDGPVLQPLTPDRLRHTLARAARWTRGGTGDALPPMAVVRDMLADPTPPLPVLARLVQAPCFSRDGRIVSASGYDPHSRLLCAFAPGLDVPDVPPAPTDAVIRRARSLLLDELLGDFPFVGEAERAHAVALLLLPFLRELIDGPTPLHLIEKPAPGTGASLLADVLLWPSTGRAVPVTTEGRDDDEWRKRLTAALVRSPAIFAIDNVRRRLDSGALSAAITATTWEDRLLGLSETVRVPVRCAWLATGNNVTVSNELARRTARIRLDARTDRPWLRTAFRHPDLRGWAASERPALIGAALTLGQAWIAAGRPPGMKPLGMFEAWAHVLGGVLAVAGVPGFLNNSEAFYEASDAEAAAWRAFVAAWWDTFADREVAVADLFPVASEVLGLPLGDGSEKSQRTRLGLLLTQARDRIYDGIRITFAGERRRASLWRLTPGVNVGERWVNVDAQRSHNPSGTGAET